MRLSPRVPESARTGGSRTGPPRRRRATLDRRSSPIHRFLLAAAIAAAICCSGTVAQAHRAHCTTPTCAHRGAHSCLKHPACVARLRHHRDARIRREQRTSRSCGTPACNRRLGRQMIIRRYGLAGWNCTYPIIDQESGWDATIHNGGGHGYVPGLSYGIPQALPGSKMAAAGRRWVNDAATQIRWMLGYFQGRYGGPCGALAHKRSTGWY